MLLRDYRPTDLETIHRINQGEVPAVGTETIEDLADIAEQSKASAASLKGQLEQARQQTDTRTNDVKAGLEQILTAKEDKLVKELEALTQNLSGVRVDLERQMSTSGQVSSLLNNMATVFSDEKSLPSDPARVKSSKDV